MDSQGKRGVGKRGERGRRQFRAFLFFLLFFSFLSFPQVKLAFCRLPFLAVSQRCVGEEGENVVPF